ncbi:hypothetical protein LY78DRAFT_590766 [Colletotrichum sublineola]|nr:hypothetical protein LY78DRAFT_590766 [Colletotrichum sublineola]
MKLSLHTIFIAAAYGAAAVQIHFHTTTGCNGAFLSCSNLPPNGCCSSTRQFQSVDFVSLDTSSNLDLSTYRDDRCSSRNGGGNSRGRSSVCISQETLYTSANWGRIDFKRDVEGGNAPFQCIRPQELEFTDGTHVNLAPQTPKDLPEEFQQLKMLA